MEVLNYHRKEKPYVLLAISIGAFLSTFNIGMVNVSLPSIAAELNTNITIVQWISSAYLLSMSALLLVFGNLSDNFGRKRIYNWGYALIVIFTIPSILAPNVYILIVARIFQGVGGAMLQANGLALVTANYPQERRGRNIGILASISAIGSLAGPALGGVVTGFLTWRAIFILNGLVAITGFIISKSVIPSDNTNREQKFSQTFDMLGAIYSSIAMISLIYAVSNLNTLGWTSPRIIVALTIFLISTFALVIQERKSKNPILDYKLFHNHTFWTSIMAALISFTAMYSIMVLLPFFYEDVLGFNPQKSGFLLMSFPLGMALTSSFAGRLSDRIGYTLLTTGGLLLNALALIVLASANEQTSLTIIVIAVFGMGAALGLFQSPNNSCIMGSVPKNRLSSAAGISQLAKNLGMVLGITLSVAIFQFGMDSRSELTYERAFFESAALVYYLAAGLSVIGALFSLNRSRKTT